jgi:hypothetical protein
MGSVGDYAGGKNIESSLQCRLLDLLTLWEALV